MERKVCTFFGHRNTPEEIRIPLHDTLVHLIEQEGVTEFYVGNQGAFDIMVKQELKKLAVAYPTIRYAVVLAYMPGQQEETLPDAADTLYPAELETVPRKFAIDKRNRLMIEWADIVVTYVCYTGGGAAKFKEIAEKKGKKVINLCQK